MNLFRPLIVGASLIIASTVARAQNIAINIDGSSAHASALLDIKSTTKGMLVPRMTEAERNAISMPATGLLIFQTNNSTGFYYFNGSAWTGIAGSSSTGWSLTGNSGTNPATDFLGTSDNQPLRFRVNNLWAGELSLENKNSFFGENAGNINATGNDNTGFGYKALSSLTNNTRN